MTKRDFQATEYRAESYEKGDEMRGDSVTERCATQPRDGAVAAWATFYPNGSTESVYAGIHPPNAEPLYRACQDLSQKNLTLTSHERGAIEWAAIFVDHELGPGSGDALYDILERLK